MHPAHPLLVDYLRLDPDEEVLLLEGGGGWLAEQVATRVPEGKVLTLARDVREFWSARERLAGRPNAVAGTEPFPEDISWSSVLLTIPKGRRYARTLLLAAWKALRPGGQLLLAGPTKEGAKAVITDAKRLFGNATVLGYRNHQRVARAVRGESLPEPLPKEFQQPGIAPGTVHRFDVERPEGTLTIESHPGIFSWEAVDEGTALLLAHLEVRAGERVWDVGCGSGVIGLAAALAGAERVAMSDINLLAVRYAGLNAERNGLQERVVVFPADGISSEQGHWDLIVSNPPFHQGHQVDTSMPDQLIARAPQALASGGRLLLVANRFLAYDKAMRQHFAEVRRIAETTKFHLLEARGPVGPGS